MEREYQRLPKEKIKQIMHDIFTARPNEFMEKQNVKISNFPRYLYRYVGILDKEGNENKKIVKKIFECIERNKLYVSSIDGFNDLFDSYSFINEDKLEDYVNNKNFLRAFLKTHCRNMSEYQFELFEQCDNWCDFVRNIPGFEDGKNVFRGDDAIKFVRENAIKFANENSAFQTEQARKDYYAACFTDANDNLPMWYFYASKYKGLCFKYDISDINTLQKRDVYKYNLFPIVYTNELCDFNEIFYLEENPRFQNVSMWFITHKLECWENENEWRLISHKAETFNPHGKTGDEADKLMWASKSGELDFIKPCCVYKGHDMMPSISAFVDKLCRRNNIKCLKMQRKNNGRYEAAE